LRALLPEKREPGDEKNEPTAQPYLKSGNLGMKKKTNQRPNPEGVFRLKIEMRWGK